MDGRLPAARRRLVPSDSYCADLPAGTAAATDRDEVLALPENLHAARHGHTGQGRWVQSVNKV